jgi:hypothetical protein
MNVGHSDIKRRAFRQREGDSQSEEDESPPKQGPRSDNLLQETALAKIRCPTLS